MEEITAAARAVKIQTNEVNSFLLIWWNKIRHLEPYPYNPIRTTPIVIIAIPIILISIVFFVICSVINPG